MKHWSENNRDVWYTTDSGKVACDSTKGLAREDRFYEVPEITEDQVIIIKRMSMFSNEDLHPHHMKYLDDFLRLQLIDKLYKDSGTYNEELEKTLYADRCNMFENIHTNHENQAKPILQKLLSDKNLSVLDDKQNMLRFIVYLGHQMTRSKAFRDTVKLGTSRLNNSFPEQLSKAIDDSWWFLSYMLGMNIGYSLYASRAVSSLCLLINETDESFIAGDDPIVNVHKSLADIKGINTPEQADFYYPISPKIAFMINDSEHFGSGIITVAKEQVEMFNKRIASKAYKHIFGDNKEVIEKYKSYVGTNIERVKTEPINIPLMNQSYNQ